MSKLISMPQDKSAYDDASSGLSAQSMQLLRDCTLCPRACHVNRLTGNVGYCGQTASVQAARAALHYWEEPCISGENGSGTVFFSGCCLRCIYCQNHDIALGKAGKPVSIAHLAEIFLTLQKKGAHNINLVTPSHFIPQIIDALTRAKNAGLTLPIVYNTGGYEEVTSLRLLDGLVDIYLPDLKYCSAELGRQFSNAPDYFDKASAAIAEMYRQVGAIQLDNTGLLKRGMIVRHLILPEQTKDSKKVLRYLHETYGDTIYVSIMNQYTPLAHVAKLPPLDRRITPEEYANILRFAERLGIDNGFIQEGDTAQDSFIPPFDYSGL